MARRPSSFTVGGYFNQNLDNVTWAAGLQSLTFGKNFDQNLDNMSKFGSWPRFQSESGQYDMASSPSKFDFWLKLAVYECLYMRFTAT